jgi:hypothetical protein
MNSQKLPLLTAAVARFCLLLLLAGLTTLLRAQQVDADEIDGAPGINLLLEVKALAEAEREAQAQAEAQQEARSRARTLELSRQLSLRQQALEDMQSDLGIYDPALLEAYSDLAAFYDEIEDYENAVKLFSDALQVARISAGLNSELQLPVLRNLIAANRKLELWQEVDDLYELSLHINTRLYALIDARFLANAKIYGSWKLELLRGNLLQQNFRGLSNRAIDLSDFYERIIVSVENQPDVAFKNLLQLISDKAQADLALARTVASTPYTAFEATASPYITQTRCQNVRTANGVVRQCYSVQVENPRYRQSQRDAKQYAINRHTRNITRSIERLESIRGTSTDLSPQQIRDLDSQIVQLQNESQQLLRAGPRRLL